MKDFLFVIPKNWTSLEITPLSAMGKLKGNDSIAYFGIEGLAGNKTLDDSLEITIDFNDCHFIHSEFDKNNFVKKQVDAIDFHYYFHIDPGNRKIIVSSCLFSILPVYYAENNDIVFISNRAKFIAARFAKSMEINNQFLIEQALFNYSFQNATIYQGIKLLDTNSTLAINNGIKIEKYFSFEDFYCSNPVSKNKSIDRLSDLFISEVKKYFSIEKSALSFTSGYDGRTLLACARYYKKKFAAYSFGAADNDDIYVPQATAEKLRIPFRAMLLDEDYAENEFYPNGVELMDLTDGNNNFLQIHHLYAAKLMAKDHDCLLNGMFGSELFRALHISGQVTSRELVSIFSIDEIDNLIDTLRNSPKLAYFNTQMIATALDDVLENVADYKAKISASGLTKNQQFYNYIFEEAFRKYFGYIIAPQMKYVNIRSPFLNFNFIKELFKSELAGVNNDFFTHNPLKRFKGQLLYARIIEKTDKELFVEKTTKGYSPKDLLSFFGRIKVAYGFFRKKLIRKVGPSALNNLKIISGIERSKSHFAINSPYPLFADIALKKILKADLDSPDRDAYIQFLGNINFINKNKDKFNGRHTFN